MNRPVSPPEHCHNETVTLAARWLVDQREPPAPLIPELRQRFGLTSAEACEVCGLAYRYRTLRGAFS